MQAPLNTPKKTNRGYAPEGTKLVVHPFQGRLGRTRAGSPTLTVFRREPEHCDPSHRRLAQLIYDLASHMERLSDEMDARWVISVEIHEARIVVELLDESEVSRAEELLRKVMEMAGLN